MPPVYRLALASLSSSGLGTPIISDVINEAGVPDGHDLLHYAFGLNGQHSIEFTLPVDSDIVTRANFALGQRELHLYRDEELIWGGRLWQASVAGREVSFAGAGWYSTVRRWELEEDFALFDTPQFDIAWSLIDTMQAEGGGNVGITRGTETGSAVERDVTYCQEGRQNVGDALEDLAAADDGFDFDITPTKAWTVWAPRRGSDLSGSIVLDGAVNAADISYDEDAYSVNSEVAGVPEVPECSVPNILYATDSGALSAYGLLQSTIARDDVPLETLQGLIEEELRITKTPLFTPRVVLESENLDAPDLLDYELGDIVTITASRGPASGYGSYTRTARIVGIEVSVGLIGRETVTLDLDGAVA